jgi:uncharacterized protein with HEPN domain
MRTPRLLLQDILDAIAEIERYTPATPEAFDADPPVQSHVVRHIAIIGEAASHLPTPVREAHPNVPWREIVDMRNIVVHVYHGINWRRVYDTARKDVPALKPQIESILASLPPESGGKPS